MLVKLPFCVIFLFFSVIIVATIHTEWQDLGQSLRAVEESGPVYRLNNSTEPTYYELWMETQVQDEIFNYSGRVIINFRVLEPTKIVTIHSLVKIQSYKILKDQDEIGVSEIEFNNITEILSFILSDEIKTDSNYLLDIHFTGILNDQSHGFFYRRFTEKTNEVSYIATTYLHSGNARFAFPCYDEPRYRTIFLIHVTHHPSMEAISNMPVDYIANNTDGSVTTTFEETPPTTPNLIIITVADYASKTRMGPRDIPVTIYAPKSFIHEVDFALDYTIPVIPRIELFMGYEYNMPKLDYVSLLDFVPGAMENWGTFVFDSQYMLYKKDTTTESQRVSMARIITHELVHNYFGSLVGIKWWTDMWIIEAFANFGEFYFTDVFLPDYNLRELYVTDVMYRSLIEHSFIGTRSIAAYIEEPDEIRLILEGYLSKAAFTMRMVLYAYGEEKFRNCVQKLVRSMSFDVVGPEDVYEIFEETMEEQYENDHPEIKVSDLLRSWIEQPGYPLLIANRDYEKNEIYLTQHRFLSSRNESDPTNSSWYIPLSMSTSREPNMNETRPCVWMKPDVEELVLKPDASNSWGEDDWVLFNIQQTVYFRINYDTRNWRLLARELHQGYPFRIPPLNRAQLIDDSFSLAYSDVIDFPLALDIIKYVINEDQYTIWQAANRHLLSLNRLLDGPAYEKYFGRFLQHLTDGHLDKLDVFENINPNESISSTFIRPIIVDLACRSGSGKCLTATRVLVMAESLTGHRLVPREVSSVYYCHGLRNANYETFKYFWEKFHNLSHEQERSHFSNSLTCYHDEEVVMDILLSTLAQDTPEFMYSTQERLALLATSFRNGHVRLVVDFFQENHPAIAIRYGFRVVVEGLLREMTSYLHLDEDIKSFVSMLDTLESFGHISDVAKKRITDEMEHNFEWVNDNKKDIEEWIQNYFEPGSVSMATRNFLTIGIFIAVATINYLK